MPDALRRPQDRSTPHEAPGLAAGSPNGRFPLTRWTLVAAAGAEGTIESRAALEELCQLYWPPVYAFSRSSGTSREEAEDLTQAFFARLLSRQDLGKAEAERGKFRTYLLTCLKHFVLNEKRAQQAQKRGGGTEAISLDADQAEEWLAAERGSHDPPDRIFERQWAATLLNRVFELLKALYHREGKDHLFEALSPLLAGVEERGTSYDEVAANLEMSIGAARMAVFRMRNRFRDLLREEIAETVGSEEEVEDEIEALFRVFRG